MWPYSIFTTLTYSTENLPAYGSLSKEDLRNFFKRLRYHLGYRKIKYFACGEYGETSTRRPHYHCIIFGMKPSDHSLIEAIWKKGFVKTGTVTFQSARYTAQYILKKLNTEESYSDTTRPFSVNSQGIGLEWAIQNKEYLEQHLSLTLQGKRMSIPKYYRDKLGIETQDELAELVKQKNIEIHEDLDNRGLEGQERMDYITAGWIQRNKTLKAGAELRQKGDL